MARRRDINDIDDTDDEDGLVDYSGESDDDDKSKDILPDYAFRRRLAPDIGAVDTSQPHQYSILREDNELLVRSNQAFRCEMTLPVEVELPKMNACTGALEG